MNNFMKPKEQSSTFSFIFTMHILQVKTEEKCGIKILFLLEEEIK